MNERALDQRSLMSWAVFRHGHGVVLLGLLLATLLLGLGSSLHSRVLWLGEQLWDNYYLIDPAAKEPTCDPNRDLDAAVQRQLQEEKEESLGLLASEPDPTAIRESLRKNIAACKEKHAQYQAMQEQITPALIAFKAVEQTVSDFLVGNISLTKYLFVAIMGLAAASAAFTNEQIGLRLPASRQEWWLSSGSQLVANGLMLWSMQHYIDQLAKAPDTQAMITMLDFWSAVFAILMVVNCYRLVRVPARYESRPLTPRAGLVVPLYAGMAMLTFGYFYLTAGQHSGLAINFGQMGHLSSMFINIGLYVFVGMCLKQTDLPRKLLAIIEPWRLPPATLAIIMVLAAAFPTAFTGASGIFVLAVGGVIYEEMRRAGAGRQLSLATTAMSGSMGVVLNPCLLIVVIAALNKEVTTNQLFGWGYGVFALSALLFAIVVAVSEKQWRPMTTNKRAAMRASWNAMVPLWPYLASIVVVVAAFWFILDLQFNEHSAPMVLPILMLVFVYLDSRSRERENVEAGFRTAVIRASSESAVHIGALLALIGFTLCLGGVLERSAIMELIFPETLQSVWLVMLSIVVMLTFIGMIMEPFGAVVLVSATIAQAALARGIDPVHFWMVTLVAFELGYLSPPVALNHLLTRQVVGETEVLAAETTGSFWRRYQRLVMPLVIMGTALLIVGFVPLFFYG